MHEKSQIGGDGPAAPIAGCFIQRTEVRFSPTPPREEQAMRQTICLTLPLLPGTTDVDREEMLACWRGARSAEHRASRARHGITREAAWIQPTPAGDVVTVLLESDDLAASLFGIASSDEPFDVWFRAHAKAVHGVDLAAGMHLPEQILGYSA
jgi:hypothetical protein